MPETYPMDKPSLRRQLRQRRAGLGAPERASAAASIARHLQAIPDWSPSRRLASYLPQDGEIDPVDIVNAARALGKTLYLPTCEPGSRLAFARWDMGDQLSPNRYGIPEPGPQAERCAVAAIDMLLVPLVGWDTQGNRLGMGGGYYDRTLAGVSGPIKVGLGFELQRQDNLPREAWDIALDYVVTEAALYDCGATFNPRE